MGIRTKSLITFVSAIILSLGVMSCGLDTFSVLEPPRYVRNNNATVTNETPDLNYIDFQVNHAFDKISIPDITFLGTAVFYKIYSSPADVTNFNSIVDNVNSDSYYDRSAPLIVNSNSSNGNKPYKELMIENAVQSPLISYDKYKSNVCVFIRLTNYNRIDDPNPSKNYEPQVVIYTPSSNSNFPSDSDILTRYTEIYRFADTPDKKYKFDFGRYSQFQDCQKPLTVDEDFTGSESASKFYIDLYAIAVGRDMQFKTVYSNVLHLGTVCVSADNTVN